MQTRRLSESIASAFSSSSSSVWDSSAMPGTSAGAAWVCGGPPLPENVSVSRSTSASHLRRRFRSLMKQVGQDPQQPGPGVRAGLEPALQISLVGTHQRVLGQVLCPIRLAPAQTLSGTDQRGLMAASEHGKITPLYFKAVRVPGCVLVCHHHPIQIKTWESSLSETAVFGRLENRACISECLYGKTSRGSMS